MGSLIDVGTDNVIKLYTLCISKIGKPRNDFFASLFPPNAILFYVLIWLYFTNCTNFDISNAFYYSLHLNIFDSFGRNWRKIIILFQIMCLYLSFKLFNLYLIIQIDKISPNRKEWIVLVGGYKHSSNAKRNSPKELFTHTSYQLYDLRRAKFYYFILAWYESYFFVTPSKF